MPPPAEPTALTRRSPIYRELEGMGATFGEINGFAAPMTCGGARADEAEAARQLGLCDATALPRSGYKGSMAIAWTRNRGCVVGESNNRAYAQGAGELVSRLADT